jgi:hypothetical protein
MPWPTAAPCKENPTTSGPGRRSLEHTGPFWQRSMRLEEIDFPAAPSTQDRSRSAAWRVLAPTSQHHPSCRDASGASECGGNGDDIDSSIGRVCRGDLKTHQLIAFSRHNIGGLRFRPRPATNPSRTAFVRDLRLQRLLRPAGLLPASMCVSCGVDYPVRYPAILPPSRTSLGRQRHPAAVRPRCTP